MAEQTNPLKPLFTDIAAAIREKDESTEKIPADTFPERIRAISSIPDGVRTINVTADPPEGGTVSGSGMASDGMTVTVHANPASEYLFDGWNVDNSVISTEKMYSFPVEKDTSLTGTFSKKDSLPDGYTRLEYVEVPQNAYVPIGTNSYADNISKIELDMSKYAEVDSTARAVMGWSSTDSITASSGYRWILTTLANTSLYIFRLIYKQTSSGGNQTINIMLPSASDVPALGQRFLCAFDFVSNTMSIDGVQQSSQDLNFSGTSQMLYLLGVKHAMVQAKPVYYTSPIRLYGCKIYNLAGDVFRNFVACKDANGVVGLWDFVLNRFFEPISGHTGALVAGPEI